MIHWDVSPDLIQLGPLTLRWYGIFFAVSFIFGNLIIHRMFRLEKADPRKIDPLFLTMMIGTIAGARLGHTLFYEPEVYLREPLRILMVWEGGLASHGAAIGIILSLAWFSRRHKLPLLWLLDRLSIPVALAGGFIRLGNLMNSEILGKPATVPWAFVFTQVDNVPRHPAQLYEALTYFAVFFCLSRLYRSPRARDARGLIFGAFLTLVFGSRFLWEFLKESQVGFESELPLDLGQLLSLPLILAGIWLLQRGIRALPRKP